MSHPISKNTRTIVVASLLLLIASGIQFWYYATAQRIQSSVIMEQALERARKEDDAINNKLRQFAAEAYVSSDIHDAVWQSIEPVANHQRNYMFSMWLVSLMCHILALLVFAMAIRQAVRKS